MKIEFYMTSIYKCDFDPFMLIYDLLELMCFTSLQR